jgi:hypothetical protein
MNANVRPTHGALTLLVGAIVSCATLALPGCAESEPAPPTPETQNTIHVYTVRGEVDALESATTDFSVRHEAIPEFIGPEGTVVGMGPMIMAFWPPQGLSLDQARVQTLALTGIEPGDKVELTFEVLHDPQTHAIRGYYATSVRELAPETELDFSPLEKAGE